MALPMPREAPVTRATRSLNGEAITPRTLTDRAKSRSASITRLEARDGASVPKAQEAGLRLEAREPGTCLPGWLPTTNRLSHASARRVPPYLEGMTPGTLPSTAL